MLNQPLKSGFSGLEIADRTTGTAIAAEAGLTQAGMGLMNQMIDIAAYEVAIGRKPRGYGVWRFVIGAAAIYHHTGTFASAAKSAVALALNRNEHSIKLLPPAPP